MIRTIINTTDLQDGDWQFLRPKMSDAEYAWQTYSSKAQKIRPAIGDGARLRRLKACVNATRAAQQAEHPILISHLPIMAAWTNLARKVMARTVPQIAFAFNFTNLPTGMRRHAYAHALSGIEEFVVFSTYEKNLYAEFFGLPAERLHFTKWAMDTPIAGPRTRIIPDVPYLCAIGGEARDYALLSRVMQRLPHRQAVVVARPYSVAGFDFPGNVQVHLNLPSETTWRVAVDSVGMALPLRSRETMCGHITVVAAQLLGIPLIATDCLGLSDYVNEESAFRIVPPKDPDALAGAIEDLFLQRDNAKETAAKSKIQAQSEYSLDRWVAYLEEAVRRL